MQVLFDSTGKPYSPRKILLAIGLTNRKHAKAVKSIIANTEEIIGGAIFHSNAIQVLASLKMTHRGPFQGLRFSRGKILGPHKLLSSVWDTIDMQALELKSFLLEQPVQNRRRLLFELPDLSREKVVAGLWKMLKQLLPFCMCKHSLGLVGASIILFSIFPEAALPAERDHWRFLFKTVDYGDVIEIMRREVLEWENRTQMKLDECDPKRIWTIPAIFHLMATKKDQPEDLKWHPEPTPMPTVVARKNLPPSLMI